MISGCCHYWYGRAYVSILLFVFCLFPLFLNFCFFFLPGFPWVTWICFRIPLLVIYSTLKFSLDSFSSSYFKSITLHTRNLSVYCCWHFVTSSEVQRPYFPSSLYSSILGAFFPFFFVCSSGVSWSLVSPVPSSGYRRQKESPGNSAPCCSWISRTLGGLVSSSTFQSLLIICLYNFQSF